MTVAERIDFVKALLDNEGEMSVDDTVITAQLELAKSAILNRLYPLSEIPTCDVPDRYQNIQCRLAVRYVARMGAEGEEKHSENGIERVYSTVDDWDILGNIVPYARLF